MRVQLQILITLFLEAIQTILRREGVKNPYELLKDLTRKNEKITKNSMKEFIKNLDVSKEIKDELERISPFNYTRNNCKIFVFKFCFFSVTVFKP